MVRRWKSTKKIDRENPKDQDKSASKVPKPKADIESMKEDVQGQDRSKSTPTIWPNISVEEATCDCCGQMASAELLDKVQAFRTACGFPIPFTSIYRCPEHNENIGGSKHSLHLLSAEKNEFGAVDCGIPKAQSKNRWTMLNAARQLGANNIEVCDGHIHIGWAPKGHVMQNRLYWGISK